VIATVGLFDFGPPDQVGQAHIYAGRDENRCCDDEEVRHDEVDDIVRIIAGRREAESVAYDFHGASET